MTIETVAAPADLSNWQSLSKETLQKILAEKKNGNNLVQLNRLTNNSNNDKPAFVWYRGMVQDMYDPEYHRESPAGEFTERQPLILVPIPFTSPWTRCSSSLEDENVDMKDDEEEVQQESSKKREREEESEGSCSKKQSTGSPKAATDVSSFTSQQQRKNVWSAGCMGSNPMETPVLAHFYYESSGGPTLKLNDIVEVIGVVEPPPPPQQQDQMMVDGDDDFFEEPTPPQVPCLRVASHRKVNLEDLCPAESDDCKLEDVKSLFAASLGSEPAAEALFLSLFSQAERQGNDDAPMMTPHNGTLGCASLNFVLSTVESCTVAAHRLQSLLENMFPVVGLVDLLHQKGLLVSPGKSGRTMQPSPLALPKGSVLIIAENRLNGKLTPEEAETLQAMQCMTKNHSVPYKFEGGMQFNFEADYRIVVLSVGHVSKLMPCSLSMALKQQQQLGSSEQLPSCSQRHLQSSFVNTCSKPNTILLGRPVLDVAQQDFIERRRQARTLGQTPIEEEDFHRWLTLTRLHARSQGRQSATTEDWKNALRVDDSMRAA